MENEKILTEKYTVIKTLGQGGMGTVFLAKRNDGQGDVAIKEQIKSDRNFRQVQSEINIHKSLSHPLLPKIIEVIDTADKIYIVMEYVRGIELETILTQNGAIDESRAYKWALQILSVLEYLHNRENPIVYRDLKPSNLLVDEQDNIHLIDFGIAQEYGDVEKYKKGIHGLTRGYAAPEQYNLQFYADARTDIYAFGVTMHYVLTGKDPQKPPYNFVKVRKLNKNISLGMEEMIFKCLQPNPDKRYSSIDSLISDFKNIEGKTNEVKAKLSKRRAIISASGLAFIVLCIVMFWGLRNSAFNSMNTYYELIEEAKLCINANNVAEAEEYLNEAIETEPDATDAKILMIRVRYELDGLEAALTYAGELIKTYDNLFEDTGYLEQVGYVYYKEKRFDEARYYFETLVANNPDNELYKEYLMVIESHE